LKSLTDVHEFTEALDEIWADLSLDTRRLIYPGSEAEILCPLIRSKQLTSALNQLYTPLLTFVKAAELKENRALAAIYVLTALTYVSSGARKAFPWLR
jgi:hypothetical protein